MEYCVDTKKPSHGWCDGSHDDVIVRDHFRMKYSMALCTRM